MNVGVLHGKYLLSGNQGLMLKINNSTAEEALPEIPSNSGDDSWFMLNLIMAFFAIAVIVILVIKLIDFQGELRHINSEIYRTHGEEKAYWKSRKKRLWLSLIPFYKYK